MNDNRRRILEMLAAGKISSDEADRLLSLVEQPPARSAGASYEAETHENDEEHNHGYYQEHPEDAERHDNYVRLNTVAVAEPDDDDRASKHREDTFSVGVSPKLVVKSFNGAIEVRASSNGTVQVDARIKGGPRVDYQAWQEGDTVFVEAKKKEGISLLPRRMGAMITVTAPASTEIDLTTSNGRVEVHGIEGTGPVHTSNGRVVLERVKGGHEVRTSNGSIEISDMEGQCDLRTSNGSVRLKNARGAFKATTSNGYIRFEGEFSGGSQNSFHTSNGKVQVKLSGTPSFRLDARTTNGKVVSSLPIQSVSSQGRNQLAGTVGSGDGELVIRTSNGSVTVE